MAFDVRHYHFIASDERALRWIQAQHAGRLDRSKGSNVEPL